MKVLFYLGHPGHYHLFKHAASGLEANGNEVIWVVKHKDVLADLLRADGQSFYRVSKGSTRHLALTAVGLLKTDLEFWRIVRRTRPDVMFGTASEIAHIGKLENIPSIVVNEDDYDAIPFFSALAFPFATYILSPHVCRLGRWEKKRIGYYGYHELAYLGENRFVPDLDRVRRVHPGDEPFFLIRLSALTAHHDRKIGGFSDETVQRLIERLRPCGTVYISSEKPLKPRFEGHRLAIRPEDLHHFLAFASLYIGDSQTMAAEAAVLGTPSIRYSDFAGRLGYLNELEEKYRLTYGIKVGAEDTLLKKVDDLLALTNRKEVWARRRARMLERSVDLTGYLVWLAENVVRGLDLESLKKAVADRSFQFGAIRPSQARHVAAELEN